MDHYFRDLHLLYPVLDKMHVLQVNIGKAIETGFEEGADSCLMLLIFALGSLARYQHGETEWSHEDMDDLHSPVGIGFFNKARQIMAFLPKGSPETAQCHILAGYSTP